MENGIFITFLQTISHLLLLPSALLLHQLSNCILIDITLGNWAWRQWNPFFAFENQVFSDEANQYHIIPQQYSSHLYFWLRDLSATADTHHYRRLSTQPDGESLHFLWIHYYLLVELAFVDYPIYSSYLWPYSLISHWNLPMWLFLSF